MQRKYVAIIDWLAMILAAVFFVGRLAKLAGVIHFFRRPQPKAPKMWPQITLFQPVTRGVSGLEGALRSRATLEYPGEVQHLFLCDEQDKESQAACWEVLREFSHMRGEIIPVVAEDGEIATKTEKLLAALPYATGEVYWFLDDDVTLRPGAWYRLLAPLFQPGVGAVFGLACYTNWRNLWSSLMSGFVNANALLSYIPLIYLTEPYTITGHCFALLRSVFEEADGFKGLGRRIDDDHELARRVRRMGLRCVQTPMIYDVDNYFDTWRGYSKQMKRWFIFPRQAMLPFLTTREQMVSLIGGIDNLLPGALALLALIPGARGARRGLVASLGLFSAVYALCEILYLKRPTPLGGWLLLPVIAVIAPLQVLRALFSNAEIEWRGQRLRIRRGGGLEVLA